MRLVASRDEGIAGELVSEFGDKALAPTFGGSERPGYDVPADHFRRAVRVRSREAHMRFRYSM